MQISQEVLKFGNDWTPDVNNHFQDVIEPLQAENNAKFNATVKVEKGLRYGDDERHRLDLYSSVSFFWIMIILLQAYFLTFCLFLIAIMKLTFSAQLVPSPEADQVPVVVYIHGGGFVIGDTDVTPSMHGNIGSYMNEPLGFIS